MKTHHTPGPWTISPDILRPSIKADKKTLAWITSTHGTTLTEAEANARLIAAAPDLLAACKYAFDVLMRMPEEYAEAICELTLRGKAIDTAKLENAIAKTKGD